MFVKTKFLSLTAVTADGRSDDHQQLFFKSLKTDSSSALIGQFKYTGFQREKDFTEGAEPVIYQSTLENYNQAQAGGPGVYQNDDGVPGRGDSFTNIPYIQEFSLRYIPAGNEVTFYRWVEG